LTESKARFALRWGDASSRLRIVSTTMLPGESVSFTAVDRRGSVVQSQATGADSLLPDGAGGWTLVASTAPALHEIAIGVPEAGDTVRLNVWVAVPWDAEKGGVLDGYRLGRYPDPAEAPRAFVQVTAENAGVRVAPHFTLGQFVCKQPGGFPKYLVLDDRIPLMLEALLERVREAGVRASSLHVMSGFRTPAYNRDLGNVSHSRHLWGAAADVFVDESPRDGIMDDVNGDGRVDTGDTDWLARLAESLEDESESGAALAGGVGRYAARHDHGPFVHVDIRSRPARW
jgi:hypothetical protein